MNCELEFANWTDSSVNSPIGIRGGQLYSEATAVPYQATLTNIAITLDACDAA